jgi:hypothetical protein
MISVLFYVDSGEIDSVVKNTVIRDSDSLIDRGLRVIYVDHDFDIDDLVAVKDGQPIFREKLESSDLELTPDTEEIIFYRDEAGLGDLVTTLGAVQDVHEAYPDARKTYVARSPISDVLQHHPAIDRILQVWELTETEYPVIRFGNPCPASQYEGMTVPHVDKDRIELFKLATQLGNSNTKPKLYLTDDEIRFGKSFVGDLKVGMVYKTSAKWRDYPEMTDLILGLDSRGIEPVIIDDVVTINSYRSTIGMSIREICSVIDALDVIVTPDTGWLHVAGALDKKLVTLFGSIDPKFRTGMYDSIDLVGGCPYDLQPCWYAVCDNYDKFMPCMMNIELAEIIRVTMERLDEVKI